MILPFKTHINGKPTWFVYKIWQSLKPIDLSEYIAHIDESNIPVHWMQKNILPKLHTIREDKAERWKPGIMIDYFINSRTKDMFRFAPRIPVVSTQTIFFDYFPKTDSLHAIIDGKHQSQEKLRIIAQNDGFDSYEDFKEYFKPLIPSGSPKKMKLIHWTDFKY